MYSSTLYIVHFYLTAHEQTLRVWHPLLLVLLGPHEDQLQAVARQIPLLPAQKGHFCENAEGQRGLCVLYD